MAWIEGFPSTIAEYNRMCSSGAFKRKLIEYVKSIMNTDVPLQPNEDCPKCKVGKLTPMDFDKQAYENVRRKDNPFPTARCNGCGERFGGNEIILENLERECLTDSAAALTESAIFARTASSKPFSIAADKPKLEAVLSTRSLLSFQSHHWFHSRSCFKRTKRTPSGKVCWMFFPKQCRRKTEWTSAGCIEQQRKVGNEYINTYIPVISSMLKCNHDVKFLGGGEGPHKSFYMMKYCTKPQIDIENPAALHLHAYDKANANSQDLADDFSRPRSGSTYGSTVLAA
ncbi:LOW QUALITY PROTEIN: hypothetical protein PHMEG_00019643 [Phytophthora megakarya]|uniref:Uncharacterized protein n=1 Tax=Phytophthora megakarya TaxID=4795 RepID=A0A225VRF0_9STRA|nr:LOW QUALITY PROTEIN: hypothetical protein PHMEG_00019643 [Phytophthora megakarya]